MNYFNDIIVVMVISRTTRTTLKTYKRRRVAHASQSSFWLGREKTSSGPEERRVLKISRRKKQTRGSRILKVTKV